MDLDDSGSKRRGRGRGTRARGRGRGQGTRGRGRGRGKKVSRIVSSDEEISQDPVETSPVVSGADPVPVATPIEPVAIKIADDPTANKENEMDTTPIPEETILVAPTIDMEADISQLEAPTFTTISRGPPEPMLRLKWDHKVSLIGEKVLNPMIHCCDQCEKPILVYGRMIPCKHIFCLKCARAEPIKTCPRCKDKVVRVEQSGLGTVFMCTHGGSRYGNTGCRRTYLSQRDLQAHINHRHVTPAALNPENSIMKSTQLLDMKTINVPQRKSTEVPSSSSVSSSSSSRPQQRSSLMSQSSSSQSSTSQPFGSSISVVPSSLTSRTNLINVPIQEAQQQQHNMSKINVQQSLSAQRSISQSMHTHHNTDVLAASSYYNTTLQSYVNASSGTYSAPSVQTIMTQNYNTVPSVTPTQSGNTASSSLNLNSRPSTVPPPPTPPQQPAYYAPYGNQYAQQIQQHYQYEQNSYQQSGGQQNHQQNQQWNQQQYYR